MKGMALQSGHLPMVGRRLVLLFQFFWIRRGGCSVTNHGLLLTRHRDHTGALSTSSGPTIMEAIVALGTPVARSWLSRAQRMVAKPSRRCAWSREMHHSVQILQLVARLTRLNAMQCKEQFLSLSQMVHWPSPLPILT